MKRVPSLLVAVACALACVPALSEEGMWTFDNLPLKEMQSQYHFAPSPDWLQKVQGATVRLSEGCTGVLVSQDGLLLTNQHCVNECLAQISTPKRDYAEQGFSALTRDEELRCPEMEVDQPTDNADVTDKINAATRGLEDDRFAAALRSVESRLENDCTGGDPRRWSCEVTDLYHGGRYVLYKYRRYQDVRLVFTPEDAIADFGGDPDNFNFPRYSLDVAVLRLYERGRTAHTGYLPFSTHGVDDGALVLTTGNPGSTERDWTVAELRSLRDDDIIPSLIYYSELRGLLQQYGSEGHEQQRMAYANLTDIENVLKDYRGELQALEDRTQMDRKAAEEADLRNWVLGDPVRATRYGDPWTAIAQAESRYHDLASRYRMLELEWGFESRLFDYARTLVRAAQEREKPNAKRLEEYRDSNLPELEQELQAPTPNAADYEELVLGWSLKKLREALGVDDPLVRRVLGTRTPEEVARIAVEGTRLDSLAFREQLWGSDLRTLALSNDPMIALAMTVDDEARAVRQEYEEKVQSVVQKESAVIAQARFARDGASGYPDATFTLRLSYGQVLGWDEGANPVAPFTDFAGLYARATGSAPFQLPVSWLEAKPRLDLSTPFDFVTTNDIVGGNSGSPVIDRDGRVVGLIFDGNIHSLGGEFWYDARSNRAVALDSRALLAALRTVYGLQSLADELVNGHG